MFMTIKLIYNYSCAFDQKLLLIFVTIADIRKPEWSIPIVMISRIDHTILLLELTTEKNKVSFF